MDILLPLIDSGELIMEATHGKFDSVVASNDGTALGALSVLWDYNMDGKVPISG
jgi:ABC-type xylose transport system substrate-binding protein